MTAPEPRAELADVGALACLYRADTGALSILTPAARAEWLKLCATKDAADEPLAAAWREQGFLGASAGFPANVAAPSIRSQAKSRLDQGYALGGNRVCRLTVDAEPLAGLLGAVLRPLAAECSSEAQTVIAVTESANGAAVSVDGVLCFEGDSASARSEALRQILMALVGWNRVGALLHASTVAGSRGGVALLGQSGSGKSTLAATLVADGLAYVADDLSALDRDTNAIHPFPLGLSVKSGSEAVVAHRFPRLLEQPELVTRRIRVRYLDLKSRAEPPGSPVPLTALVFPIYDPGTTTLEAERLAPEAALHLAIESGSVPDGSPRSIRPLARLCNEVPAWHLAFADVAEASAWVRSLAGGAP